MNTTERKYVEKVASKAYVACYVQWTSTGKGSFKEALNSLWHLKCNLQFSSGSFWRVIKTKTQRFHQDCLM